MKDKPLLKWATVDTKVASHKSMHNVQLQQMDILHTEVAFDVACIGPEAPVAAQFMSEV